MMRITGVPRSTIDHSHSFACSCPSEPCIKTCGHTDEHSQPQSAEIVVVEIRSIERHDKLVLVHHKLHQPHLVHARHAHMHHTIKEICGKQQQWPKTLQQPQWIYRRSWHRCGSIARFTGAFEKFHSNRPHHPRIVESGGGFSRLVPFRRAQAIVPAPHLHPKTDPSPVPLSDIKHYQSWTCEAVFASQSAEQSGIAGFTIGGSYVFNIVDSALRASYNAHLFSSLRAPKRQRVCKL